MPNGRCRMHGGRAAVGIAAGRFKTGARSKYLGHLPDVLAQHFHPDNPRLIELTQELALVDSMVLAALERATKAKRVTAAVRKELGDLLDRRGRLVAVESRRRKDEHEMVERAEFGRFAKVFLLRMREHILGLTALDATQQRALMSKIQEDALRLLVISQGPTAVEGEVVG